MKFVDLKNKKFGRWIVVEHLGKDKNKNNIWKCRCDCGNEKVLTSANLSKGTSNSCGCLRTELTKKRNTIGYGISSFRRLYDTYKRSASSRNFIFDLTEEDFKLLTKQDCFYCGEKANNTTKYLETNGDYVYNGIDRLDSSIGYTKENSVPCCKKCNFAKGTLSLVEFFTLIKKIYINKKL